MSFTATQVAERNLCGKIENPGHNVFILRLSVHKSHESISVQSSELNPHKSQLIRKVSLSRWQSQQSQNSLCPAPTLLLFRNKLVWSPFLVLNYRCVSVFNTLGLVFKRFFNLSGGKGYFKIFYLRKIVYSLLYMYIYLALDFLTAFFSLNYYSNHNRKISMELTTLTNS